MNYFKSILIVFAIISYSTNYASATDIVSQEEMITRSINTLNFYDNNKDTTLKKAYERSEGLPENPAGFFYNYNRINALDIVSLYDVFKRIADLNGQKKHNSPGVSALADAIIENKLGGYGYEFRESPEELDRLISEMEESSYAGLLTRFSGSRSKVFVQALKKFKEKILSGNFD